MLPPLKINNQTIQVTHTCPFDALAQSLSTAYIDSISYNKYINDSQNEFLHFIRDLIVTGTNMQIYKNRAKILLKYNKTKNVKSDIIDCTCNVIELANNLLHNEPSITKILQCNICNSPKWKVWQR